MDKSQITRVEANLPECDEMLLSDRVFDTDPSQILIESSDPQKLRFRLIEWLAAAPNRKVKAEWHKQPGSHEVALTLRHAALPKQYPPEYELQKSWDICGLPFHHFFTDGGKDLARSKLIKAFGKKFGFQCELRDRPPQGGIDLLFRKIKR